MDLERLRELFSYDPVSGLLTRRVTGKVCGTRHSKKRPYLRVKVDGKMLYVHRVAFAMYHGYWTDRVDHKDTGHSNNRISNLRPCTQAENGCNRDKGLPDATSKFKGVHFEKQTQKWRAQIKVNGRKLSLGRFSSEIEAVRAYDAAAAKHHGEFARVNGV